MKSTLRAVAESRFAAVTRREEAAMIDLEAQRLATQEKTARLRALRLAKGTETVSDRAAKLKSRRAVISTG